MSERVDSNVNVNVSAREVRQGRCRPYMYRRKNLPHFPEPTPEASPFLPHFSQVGLLMIMPPVQISPHSKFPHSDTII